MPSSRPLRAFNRFGLYALSQDVAHRPAARFVLEQKVYEPATIDLIRSMCRDGDVIHAGTFFGDFLPAIAGGLAPSAKLWAFEPNPDNYRLARKTIALNRLTQVTLANLALSDRRGSAGMRVLNATGGNLGGGSHLVLDAPAAGEQVVEVDTAPLDELIPADRTITVVHLDVEGHEAAALRGARRLISAWMPILILERFDDVAFVNKLIGEDRYVFFGKVHGNAVLAPDLP